MLGIAFVGFNIIDAYLTGLCLAMGALELNTIMINIGDSLLIKGLIALAIVVGLYWFSKEKLLYPLCLAMFGVCLWNSAVYTLLKVGAV